MDEHALEAKYRDWLTGHSDDLLLVGQREYKGHGRGVILIERGDRFSDGNFDYTYWPADVFLSQTPEFAKQWATILRTYDPACEAFVVIFRDEDTRIHVGLVSPSIA